MRKLLRDLFIFLIPAYLFFFWASVPIYILYANYEMFYSVGKLLDNPNKKIVGFGYKQDHLEKYKWHHLQMNDSYDVIALGSSRTLHFREDMFISSFYNAGYSIRRLGEFKLYLETLGHAKHPELLLIGLDQWLFNDARENSIKPRSRAVWKNWNTREMDVALLKNVWSDLIGGKFESQLNASSDIELIGLNARLHGRGIRNDGSMDYGIDIKHLIERDEEFLENIQMEMTHRVEVGANRFEHGDTISPDAVATIIELLEYCSDNNIYVLGYLPPFSDFALNLMIESGNYGYLESVYDTLKFHFEHKNFELYDFTSLVSIGSDDSEILDGFHVAEIGYQKKILTIIDENPESTLIHYVDPEQLETDRTNSLNRLIVYDY